MREKVNEEFKEQITFQTERDQFVRFVHFGDRLHRISHYLLASFPRLSQPCYVSLNRPLSHRLVLWHEHHGLH